MSDETIIITKEEYNALIKIKDEYIKAIDIAERTMRVHDEIVKTFEEKCAIYEKALRM